MEITTTSFAVYGAIALLLISIVRFLYRGYQIRRRVHYLPGPPHSWIWGHFKVFAAAASKLPAGSPSAMVLLRLEEEYDLPDAWFLDAWPLQQLTMIARGRKVSDQFVSDHSLPKAAIVVDVLECVGGRQNLVVDEGPRWKTWRTAFNPGFANAHLMTLVPLIVDHVDIFCQILDDFAKQSKLFRLEKFLTRLTIDIIGRIVLDYDLNSQLKDHELVTAFESTVKWISLGAATQPSELLDFRRPWVFRRNRRTMNRFVDRILVERWRTRAQRKKSKFVIDLALESFLNDKGQSMQDAGELDPEFRKAALDQVKIFLFAGHETSASTLSYCLYYIARRADVAKNVHDELNRVFPKGVDVGQALRDNPVLINKLDYVTAVIREVLRMHPTSNSAREGVKGFFVTDPVTGEKHDTEGLLLLSHALGHHMHSAWGDPYTFRPERWLDGTVPDGSWIPFSKNPRSCIGQELSMIEIRIVLAMSLSRFDFRVCFDELGKLKGDGSGYQSRVDGIQEVWGWCDAYQQGAMSKPREGMPVRVKHRAL